MNLFVAMAKQVLRQRDRIFYGVNRSTGETPSAAKVTITRFPPSLLHFPPPMTDLKFEPRFGSVPRLRKPSLSLFVTEMRRAGRV